MVVRRRARPPKRKRAVSAYNRFIGSKTKGGKMTMKQAAALWKRGGRAKRKTSTRAAPKRRRLSRGKTRSVRKVGKSGFNSQKIMKYIRLAALGLPAAGVAMDSGLSGQEKLRVGLQKYTGVDMRTGQFHLSSLAEGWLPYLASIGVTYGIPKIAGLIRGA